MEESIFLQMRKRTNEERIQIKLRIRYGVL